MSIITSKVLASIKDNEGYRRHPYTDTTGNLTIGYGRNLDSVGISHSEAEVLALNDIDGALNALRYSCPGLAPLNDARYAVCVEMVFNLGITGFMGFKKMRAALSVGDYPEAARQALDSKWARQVGDRAVRLASQLASGGDLE